MSDLIVLKRSAVQGKVPQLQDLNLGEIAINTFDGKTYIKRDNGDESVIQVGSIVDLQKYSVKASVVNWSGAVSHNFNSGNIVQATIDADVTGITISGWPPSGFEGRLTIYLKQGATPRTVNGWSNVSWVEENEIPAPAANSTDIVVLTSVDGGTSIYGFYLGRA